MKRGTVVGLAAAGAALALIAGVSVVWPGLDAQRTPPRQTTAWVLQADSLRYARVNTAIGEIDTVRAVSNPSRIVGAADAAYMFTDSDAKVVRIDDAAPVDLDADGLRSATAAPAGTADMDASGDIVAYRTDAGTVFVGRLSAGPAAGIVADYRVSLPRPRDIADIRLEKAFHEIHRDIWSSLRVEVQKAYAMGEGRELVGGDAS